MFDAVFYQALRVLEPLAPGGAGFTVRSRRRVVGAAGGARRIGRPGSGLARRDGTGRGDRDVDQRREGVRHAGPEGRCPGRALGGAHRNWLPASPRALWPVSRSTRWPRSPPACNLRRGRRSSSSGMTWSPMGPRCHQKSSDARCVAWPTCSAVTTAWPGSNDNAGRRGYGEVSTAPQGCTGSTPSSTRNRLRPVHRLATTTRHWFHQPELVAATGVVAELVDDHEHLAAHALIQLCTAGGRRGTDSDRGAGSGNGNGRQSQRQRHRPPTTVAGSLLRSPSRYRS